LGDSVQANDLENRSQQLCRILNASFKTAKTKMTNDDWQLTNDKFNLRDSHSTIYRAVKTRLVAQAL
jgi:hypothetical protein